MSRTKLPMIMLSLFSFNVFTKVCLQPLTDNAVEGDPALECANSFVAIRFQTRNPFRGTVYLKGQYNDAVCQNSERGYNNASITLPFNACGTKLQRIRSERTAKFGLSVSGTVIISFNSDNFISKADRAFEFECLYLSTEKPVSADIDVATLSTTAVQIQSVEMPNCRYEIIDGSATGNPIEHAVIGQSIYHKWTCETKTVNVFCMTVHSCHVDDSNDHRIELLKDNGCSSDRYLLKNLEYLTDLVAGQESYVFKYADRTKMDFKCQIAISVKEPDHQCARPNCEVRRHKRRAILLRESNSTQQSSDVQKFVELSAAQDSVCFNHIGYAIIITAFVCALSTSLLFFIISIHQLWSCNRPDSDLRSH